MKSFRQEPALAAGMDTEPLSREEIVRLTDEMIGRMVRVAPGADRLLTAAGIAIVMAEYPRECWACYLVTTFHGLKTGSLAYARIGQEGRDGPDC